MKQKQPSTWESSDLCHSFQHRLKITAAIFTFFVSSRIKHTIPSITIHSSPSKPTVNSNWASFPVSSYPSSSSSSPSSSSRAEGCCHILKQSQTWIIFSNSPQSAACLKLWSLSFSFHFSPSFLPLLPPLNSCHLVCVCVCTSVCVYVMKDGGWGGRPTISLLTLSFHE